MYKTFFFKLAASTYYLQNSKEQQFSSLEFWILWQAARKTKIT